MILLNVSDLSLSFGGKQVLSDLNFSVNEGDRLGIIGTNGAGKTTLFRLITGEYTPDRGSVFLSREKTVGVLEQNALISEKYQNFTLTEYLYDAFPELLSLEEEIASLEHALLQAEGEALTALSARLAEAHTRYQNEGGAVFRSRAYGMLLRMGFSPEEIAGKVSALSGGQFTRLSLAKLLTREPDLLMLDEPTNHLDLEALAWLEGFLANYKKTVLVISHDRYFLDKVTNKTLKIENAGGRLYVGNYSRAKEQEAQDLSSLQKKYKEQQKEIARIQANIDFQRRCGQEHNFVTIRSKEKQLARMEKVSLTRAQKEIRMSFSEMESTANDVLEAKELSFSYGGTPLLEHLSFAVQKQERVLFLGKNGSGKSTLMKLMVGRLEPSAGYIRFGANISYAYYDQENRDLHEDYTVFEEMRAAYPQKTDRELRSALALFLFGEEECTQRISVLSGGERARLTLAKLMLKKVNLLLLDEPTNHLDIGSREALETAILAFEGTVVAISHDRYFIDRIATRILEPDRNTEKGCREFLLSEDRGAYTQYAEATLRRAEEAKEAESEAVPAVSERKTVYEQRKKETADKRNRQKRKERAEKRAAELEARIEAITAEMFGDAANDYLRVAELDQEKTQCEEELLSLYETILE